MEFIVVNTAGGAKSVVFARPVGEGKPALSSAPKLNGVAIKSTFSRLNSTNEDGTARQTLYAFQLVNAAEIERFKIGDKATLS